MRAMRLMNAVTMEVRGDEELHFILVIATYPINGCRYIKEDTTHLVIVSGKAEQIRDNCTSESSGKRLKNEQNRVGLSPRTCGIQTTERVMHLI